MTPRMRYYYRLRREHAHAGLTLGRGTVPKYNRHPELGDLHGRARKTAYEKLRRQKLARLGRSRRPLSRTELAWRELRGSMNLPQADFLTLGERNHDRD